MVVGGHDSRFESEAGDQTYDEGDDNLPGSCGGNAGSG
jgi:hypothetical protein